MRIAIDLRMLAAGREENRRGTGRFTTQQLREVLRLPAATAHEFVLVVPRGAVKGDLPREIVAAPNVTAVAFPTHVATATEPTAERDVVRLAARFSRFLADQAIDVFHATSPFLLTSSPFWHCDGCAQVATHYDLVPLLYPRLYPLDAPAQAHYRRAAAALRWADRLLAISGFVREEAAQQLGIEGGRIDVAYPMAEPWFRPHDEAAVESTLLELARRLPLPPMGEFLFTVSQMHHAKNLLTLLVAFASMSASWRRRHPLFIAGAFDPSATHSITSTLSSLGIGGETIVLDFLSEAELAALYCRCHMFVMPSRYAGFGLPALEAMACGAPLVVGRAGALVEVVGDAAIIVDPEDPAGFAIALQ